MNVVSPREVLHNTVPGTRKTIGGMACYTATPSINYPKDRVLLFLTDAFGLELTNSLVNFSCTP